MNWAENIGAKSASDKWGIFPFSSRPRKFRPTALAQGPFIRYGRRPRMSNRSLWNVRRRHEWLATPLKRKPMKKRKRLRIGLEQALQRKAAKTAAAEPAAT